MDSEDGGKVKQEHLSNGFRGWGLDQTLARIVLPDYFRLEWFQANGTSA